MIMQASPALPVTDRVAAKLAALDALANHPSAAPGERDNAARAAAAIRAQQPLPRADWKRVLLLLRQQRAGLCTARKADGSRCKVAVTAGLHCATHATPEEYEQIRRARSEKRVRNKAAWARRARGV